MILDSLVESELFNVTVLTTGSKAATYPPSVQVRKSDFSDHELESAFTGQDVVISVVGMSALTDQKRYIDIAVKVGVKHFMPSEFGANASNDVVLELLTIFQGKREVQEYLKTKESEHFNWTALGTSILLDWVKLSISIMSTILVIDCTDACEFVVSCQRNLRILYRLSYRNDLGRRQQTIHHDHSETNGTSSSLHPSTP